MYQAGDTVVYGLEGVCRIEEIAEREFAGERMRYYVLKPVFRDGSTLFLPVDNPVLTEKMRRTLSAEEIRELIHCLPEREAVWIDNESVRREACQDVLRSGDRLRLAGLIKSLYLHQQELKARKKDLRACDDRVLKEAETLLYEEFAYVLGLRQEQVIPFIAQQLENRQPLS
jgi:transcriptional regulator, carD family